MDGGFWAEVPLGDVALGNCQKQDFQDWLAPEANHGLHKISLIIVPNALVPPTAYDLPLAYFPHGPYI